MRITLAHLDFWRAKVIALPSWAQPIADHPPTIDQLINDQADPDAKWKILAVVNLVALLRMRRKRKPDLLPYLQRLAQHPGTIIRPERRAASARKWALRIRKERRRLGIPFDDSPATNRRLKVRWKLEPRTVFRPQS